MQFSMGPLHRDRKADRHSQRNGASGGSRMVDLIIRARNEFP